MVVDLTDTLPRHPTLRYRRRYLTDLTRIVIHHTAGSEDATPESIARFHVSKRPDAPGGWPGIAYHYLVAVDGTVYKCNTADTISYCVRNGNTPSLCVCLVGNREEVPAPSVQWDAAVQLVRDLLIAYPSVEAVYGHKETPTSPPQTTRCPGVWIDLDYFRAAVGIRNP